LRSELSGPTFMSANVNNLLKKIVFFDVVPNLSPLSGNERKALMHCVAASDVITEIYLRQVSSENQRWHEELKSRTDIEGRNLLRYFELNGGPWDQFNDDEPFINNVGPRPKGAALYPLDLTTEEWERWLNSRRDDRQTFESHCTVIDRRENGLVAIPYNDAYRDFLELAANELKCAAGLLASGPLERSLRLKADAMLLNEYWDSDAAWVDTDGTPFEVTLGPYEVYTDRLSGIKAAFEAYIGIPDTESTTYLKEFSRRVPAFDSHMAERFQYQPKGSSILMEVVRDVYRGGEAACGSQFVAFNLPNDRRFQQLKGSKNILSLTMLEAKFSKIGSLVAERVLSSHNLHRYSFKNRMLYVLAHEIAHGLGPGIVKDGCREVGMNVLLRELHSPLEEVKANVAGAALLQYFAEEGLVSSDDVAGCLVSEIVAFIQDWRAGYGEAHSAASMIQFNWLKAMKAVSYDRSKGIVDIDAEKTLVAMQRLMEECFKIQTAGDYNKAKSFFAQWSRVGDEVKEMVSSLVDLPHDVFPVYHLDQLDSATAHSPLHPPTESYR
jgi:hypothetical protein